MRLVSWTVMGQRRQKVWCREKKMRVTEASGQLLPRPKAKSGRTRCAEVSAARAPESQLGQSGGWLPCQSVTPVSSPSWWPSDAGKPDGAEQSTADDQNASGSNEWWPWSIRESSIPAMSPGQNGTLLNSGGLEVPGGSSNLTDEQDCRAPPDAGDCPICYEAILARDAAMRCAGDAGVHHYFHKECLGRWIQSCRANCSGATCPVCRGTVQVNISSLAAFLESPQADALPEADRGFLQQLFDRARATVGMSCGNDVWADPFTPEELSNVAMLGFATTAGFWSGFSDSSVDDLLLLTLAPAQDESTRIAAGAGYIAGITARVVKAVVENSQS